MPWIERALGSVLGQTFRDFELIISDNGSTDGTEAYCRRLAAADPRIRYFRHDTNRGANWNFKFAIFQATAPMFIFAAHDDWWNPDWLEALVSHTGGASAVRYAEIVGVDEADQPLGRIQDLGFDGPKTLRLSRFLLARESRGKANLVYGLFRTSRLRAFPFDLWERGYAGPDVHMLFFNLQAGPAAFVDGARMFKHVPTAKNAPGAATNKWRKHLWNQLTCAIGYWFAAETPSVKLLVLLLLPLKFGIILLELIGAVAGRLQAQLPDGLR